MYDALKSSYTLGTIVYQLVTHEKCKMAVKERINICVQVESDEAGRMWCSMRFAANAEGIRTKGRCVAWQPLTRETEEQKNIRT